MLSINPDSSNYARIAALFRKVALAVRGRLASVELLGEQQDCPYIAFLQAVEEMHEPERTTILNQLTDVTFTIAASEPFRIMWARRMYVFGPEPITVTLGPARKAIDHAKNQRHANVKSPRRSAPIRHRPILLSWYGFYVDSNGTLANNNTKPEQVHAGPTYAALYQLFLNRTAELQQANVRPDFANILQSQTKRTPSFPHSPPAVPAGTNFHDQMGLVQGVNHNVFPRGLNDTLLQANLGQPSSDDAPSSVPADDGPALNE